MTTQNISALTAKRRLRGFRWKIERLNGALTDLLQALPAPSPEELAAIVKREVPLTVEAWLLGALHEAQFHLEEAEEILEVAVTKTSRGLRRDWHSGSFPLDLIRSLRQVVEDRQRPAGKVAE